MRLNEVVYTDALPIDGYGDGYFRIGEEAHAAPVAVLPSGVTAWSGYDDVETLVAAAESIDVLLIGTGNEIGHLPPEFREALEATGLGVEPMASAQAARTYNVLLGEGRRVAVALMPVTRS